MTEPERAGARRSARAESGEAGHGETHLVRCAFCNYPFDLFGAAWCAHEEPPHPSKICPRCDRCVCGHSSYGDPYFWKEAPPSFRRNGFRKVFLLYI